MNFSALIGETILMRIKGFNENRVHEAKLLGVETAGIWVDSPTVTQSILQKIQVSHGKTMIVFVPFCELGLVIAGKPELALNERAFGV